MSRTPSGATFTGLTQLSSLLDKKIEKHKEDCAVATSYLLECHKGETGTKSRATKRNERLRTYVTIWRYSSSLSILTLLVFAFWVGFRIVPRIGVGGADDITPPDANFYRDWLYVILWANLICIFLKFCSWYRIWKLNREQIASCSQAWDVVNGVSAPAAGPAN